MPFGQELRAHEDVAFAAPHLGECARELAATAGAIAVDAHDARLRKVRGESLLHALRTAAHCFQVDVAAGRACAWNGMLRPAMVAVESPIGCVQHEPSRTARAARVPAAGFA